MATKRAATSNSNGSNGQHVSLAREEYEALLAREVSYQGVVADNERLKEINALASITQEAQTRTLQQNEMKISYLERVVGLQRQFLDLLRDNTKVSTFEEMSEFWHYWVVHTNKAIDANKTTREEVSRFEPDIFRSWKIWLHEAGKLGRVLSIAGTRHEVDAAKPTSAKEMQEHIIVRLKQDNVALGDRIKQLENEVAEHRSKQEKRA